TVAYQGYGEGVDIDEITERTRRDVAEAYLKPDLALILNVEDRVRQQRIAKRGELDRPDTFESRAQDFQDRLNFGYVDFAKKHDIPIIDASGSREDVEELIWHRVKTLL
ncbi:MAG TPA: hypothetical protein VFL81_03100, partial [Candidatus Saccharimonadales bacterium]|nr:hypothetical protein [Candidatus Saccharimonadales bacterium]